jgi:hypothetical protein
LREICRRTRLYAENANKQRVFQSVTETPKTKPPFGLPAIAWHTEQGLMFTTSPKGDAGLHLFLFSCFLFLGFFLSGHDDLLVTKVELMNGDALTKNSQQHSVVMTSFGTIGSVRRRARCS